MKASATVTRSEIAHKMLSDIFRDAKPLMSQIDDVYYALLHNNRRGINLAVFLELKTIKEIYEALQVKLESHINKLEAMIQSCSIDNKNILLGASFEKFCNDQKFASNDIEEFKAQCLNLVGSSFNKLQAIYSFYLCNSLIHNLSCTQTFTKVNTWPIQDAIAIYLILVHLSHYNALYVPLSFSFLFFILF